MPGGGDIGIVEGSGCCFEAVKDRTYGFLQGVKDAGGSFNVVSKQPGAWVPDKSEAACQNMLQSNPGIVLFYAQSDDMAAGCASAVKKAKSAAKVIGIGGSKLGIDAVKDGSVYGTVCYKPEDMGGWPPRRSSTRSARARPRPARPSSPTRRQPSPLATWPTARPSGKGLNR